MIENYVISQLKTLEKDFYYFRPSDNMKIDLLLDEENGIIPCEIKSGRRTNSKSLSNFCKKYLPKKAIIFSELNFGKNDYLYSYPLYSIFCLS